MNDRKDLNQRFLKEVFENRDLDAVDRFLGEDVVEHMTPPPGVELAPGREGVKRLIATYLDAFDPMTVEVHEQYEDGDVVIARSTFTGTHSGTFAGVPATGKRVSVETIDITRFDGDRMVEHWAQIDSAALLSQLGLLPPMG